MLAKQRALIGASTPLLGSLAILLGACAAPAAANLTPTRVAFLGDSYTFGVGASQPSDGYAYLVARDEGWNATIVGLPGSGYVRIAIRDGKNIAAGIPRVIASQPQLVIVECGHNDTVRGVNYALTGSAALKDLQAIRAGLPNAAIVVIGPVLLGNQTTTQSLAVRAAIHQAQEQISNSYWIDPIAQDWFDGNLAAHTGDDATMINYAAGHPDNLGYRHIASLLEADLAQLGIG